MTKPSEQSDTRWVDGMGWMTEQSVPTTTLDATITCAYSRTSPSNRGRARRCAAEVAPRLNARERDGVRVVAYPIEFAGIELQRGECEGVSYKNVRGHQSYLPSLLSTTVAGIVDIQS